MNSSRNIIRFLFLLLTSGLYVCNSAAQNSSLTDKSDTKNKISGLEPVYSLYMGIGAGNNMVYLGSNLSENKPFYSGSLTYGFKDQVFLSASASHLSAFDPFISFSNFSLSYDHNLSSWCDIAISATGYLANSHLSDTLFNNFLYGNAAIGFDWKILYTNVSAGGILSGSSSAYFNLKNSRYIESPKIAGGKAFFYFDPYVNLLFGTLTKTVTAEGTIIGVSEPFKSKKSSSHTGGGSNGTSTSYFSIMEADFGIPVGFTSGKLTVEAEPGYVLPAYKTRDDLSPEGFTLFLNIYFRIL
jgi:hypothetical protein